MKEKCNHGKSNLSKNRKNEKAGDELKTDDQEDDVVKMNRV